MLFKAKKCYNIHMKKNNNTNETIEISVTEYENLKQRVEILEEALRLSKQKQFGSSSEKVSAETKAQLIYLFDEAETNIAIEDIIAEENRDIHVPAHIRKKHTYTLQDNIPEGIEVEVIEHTLSANERQCSICGTTMQEIGEEVRRELVIIPAKLKVLEHHMHTYACMKCKNDNTEAPVIRAEKEKALIPGSFATAEAVAHIMTQKFTMYSPLYRMEKEWLAQGIELSRQTMSNWLLKSVELYLEPLYNRLREKLVQHTVLHADETPLKVLKEFDRSKCYMWLYRTGSDAEHPIILYDYQVSRGHECPINFLKGFKGYLQTDGHSGYHCFSKDIVDVGCWAHARRKFDEAIKALPKGCKKGMYDSNKGVAYIARLYKIEKELASLTAKERCSKRLELAKPVIDELFAWAKNVNAAPRSLLGKALTYLFNQEKYLLGYLQDGRLEIDNNRAERSIKPFVMGRKNFLFANTPRGAQGSAIMYSIIETARANNLKPFEYLAYVLKTAKDLDRSKEGWTEPLLPENAPKECHITTAK